MLEDVKWMLLIACVLVMLTATESAGALNMTITKPGTVTRSVTLPKGYVLLEVRPIVILGANRRPSAASYCYATLTGPRTVIAQPLPGRPAVCGAVVPAGTYTLTVAAANCGVTCSLTKPRIATPTKRQ